MANVQQVSVNSATLTAIKATQIGSVAAIQEDPSVVNWPTTDLLIYQAIEGTPSVAGRRLLAGTDYILRRGGREAWFPGDIILFVKTIAGTTTLVVDEQGQ